MKMNSKKIEKKKRNKPGYRLTDRQDALRGHTVPIDKAMYEHHLQYEPFEVKVNIDFMSHGVMHCNLKYRTPYNDYGKDYAAYFMARDIIRLFEKHPEVIAEMKKKFPEEFR